MRPLRFKYGCRSRTRTYDILINSQTLYQLSYAAVMTILPNMIGAQGRFLKPKSWPQRSRPEGVSAFIPGPGRRDSAAVGRTSEIRPRVLTMHSRTRQSPSLTVLETIAPSLRPSQARPGGRTP